MLRSSTAPLPKILRMEATWATQRVIWDHKSELGKTMAIQLLSGHFENRKHGSQSWIVSQFIVLKHIFFLFLGMYTPSDLNLVGGVQSFHWLKPHHLIFKHLLAVWTLNRHLCYTLSFSWAKWASFNMVKANDCRRKGNILSGRFFLWPGAPTPSTSPLENFLHLEYQVQHNHAAGLYSLFFLFRHKWILSHLNTK